MSEQAQIQKVFDDIRAHQRIAELIQRFSTNKHDIRRTALEGLDLKECRQILDLGCAFGSFTEKLKDRVSHEAVATGVDLIKTYEPLFLAACRRAGIHGKFFSTGASVLRTFADRSFDLILCSYALYFFPEVIPEIARLLHKKGIFIVITHHRQTAGELIELIKRILDTIGLFHEKELPLEIITGRFSSENGEALLQPWFGRIEAIDFPNKLLFSRRDIEYFLEYCRFKSPLFFTDTGLNMEAVVPVVSEHIRRTTAERQDITISKDDRIFICALPRHKEEKS